MLATSDSSVLVPGLSEPALSRAGLSLESFRDGVQSGRIQRVLVAPDTADLTASELHGLCERVSELALRVPSVELRVEPSGTPTDPWVAAALGAPDAPLFERGVLDTAERATAVLARLGERWRALHGDSPDPDLEILCRQLDDAPRRAVFRMLREAWLGRAPGWPHGPRARDAALASAVDFLGEHGKWVKRFRQFTYDGVRRMVVIPTWQCELRCSYCFIPKQDGREMPLRTMERSIDMLLTTDRDEVLLQFFGGEAALAWDSVQRGVAYGLEAAERAGKEISFVLSSNGWSLDEEKLAWLAPRKVRLELSLDGSRWTQERYRPSRWKGESSYDHSIVSHRQEIFDSGIEQYVIMVVHPTNVENLYENFFHIIDLGFRHLQINNMLGRVWKPHELKTWAEQLHLIGQELRRRWDRGEEVEFINMRHKPMAMRLNGEVTVDHDGVIYGGNGFLHETEHKAKFAVAHLDDLTGVDRYWIDATANDFLLDWSYRPKITANNLEVGKVMASLVKWLTGLGYSAEGRRAPADPGQAPAAAP